MRPPFPSCDTPTRRYARLLRCARRSAALVGLLAAAGLLLLLGIGLPPSFPRGEGPDLTVVSVPATSEAARPFTPPALEAPPAPELHVPPPAIAPAAELPELALDTDLEGEPWSPLPEANIDVEPPAPRRLAQQHPTPAPPAQGEAALTPPSYLSAPEPPYPADLRQRRIEGSVRVRISVSAEGHPTAVSIAESSGYGAFDHAVLTWIPAHWRFHPATSGGAPVSSTVTTRIAFCLR